MNFKTHNDTEISTFGMTPQGVIEVSKEELSSLFGKPIGRWMYRVQFEDGSAALLYPSGSDEKKFHVESVGKQGMDNVQIAIDLYRESAGEKFADPIEKLMAPAFDMMKNIRSVKGESYAQLVELAMLARKSHELTSMLSHMAQDAGILPKEAADGMRSAISMLTAKTISIGARMTKLDTDKNGAEELMDTVERMMKAEQEGAKGMLSKLMESKDD